MLCRYLNYDRRWKLYRLGNLSSRMVVTANFIHLACVVPLVSISPLYNENAFGSLLNYNFY